ncbi:MAG: HAD-IIB family hydrolase, partial [Bacteroidetes bacterium]|nr:HAD-IIB family hydrolase [Bacteroidota bacterium]
IEKLNLLRSTGRKLVLVTGREMKDLVIVFPEFKVFDHIVAENGAVLYNTVTGEEQLLGQGPGPKFVRELQRKGVHPLSVGRVIVATWVPHEQEVLEVIRESGCEHQVIFNKGAVMILPPGVNKATGLQALLQRLRLSAHNVVGVGDAENDSSLLQASEAAVAVGNALPSLKAIADWVTPSGHGAGVAELVDRLVRDDLAELDRQLVRHYIELGVYADGRPFAISPWRSGILLAGASGSGKTTFTIAITEGLMRKGYQYCLIDPEGDYRELSGAAVIGNERSLPPVEEIGQLLKDPRQNLVVCTLSVPLNDRPEFFSRLLAVLVQLRRDHSRPHWLILDEAHHLVPAPSGMPTAKMPSDFSNFIVVSTSPHALHPEAMSRIGMIITIGENPGYPFEQWGRLVGEEVPSVIPALQQGEICVWERGGGEPEVVKYTAPHQLQRRHKKKYAQGEMGENSFVFRGEEGRLHLVANNLLMFLRIAEGIDIETWVYHLKRKDLTKWFRDTVHDEELAKETEAAEEMGDAAAGRKRVLEFIGQRYTI